MDTKALRDAIKASGLKTSHIVSALGISASAYYYKTRGHREFTVSEMRALVQTLGLDDKTTKCIFFSGKVS